MQKEKSLVVKGLVSLAVLVSHDDNERTMAFTVNSLVTFGRDRKHQQNVNVKN